MDSEAIDVIYFVVAGVWTVFVVISAYLFMKNINYPSIKYRSVPLFFVNALTNLLVTVNIILSGPLSSKYMCFVYFWILYLCLPLWIITTLVKHIRLIILYRFGAERIVTYTSLYPSLDSENNSYLNSTTEVLSRNLFPKGSWLRRLLTPKAHIIGIIVWMIPHCILATVLHVVLNRADKGYSPNTTVEVCVNNWYWSPILGIFILYTLGVLPVILLYIRGIKDAYDMRLEVLWDIGAGTVGTLACLLSTELNEDKEFLRVFPNQMWTAVMCMCMYWISVFIPFREKRRFLAVHPSKKCAHSLFEELLTDSHLFQEFHAFSVRDFSVENPLFYNRVNKWILDMKDLEQRNCSSTNCESTYQEAHEIYRLFIASNADYEINITSETSHQISKDILTGNIGSSLFDQAIAEVLDMMLQQTFPRFLRHKGWTNDYPIRLPPI
ncbi:hypothetical protein K493DRAFT_341896 [Basidiobolus meristosporus CBS 931.73]|uniref:RGS domain-containing protein n=1 Tax=Basidiobolus meristosporus CBS 931.73 TaxID=1314790 RepID=A0A1Y1XFV2_9FUNG|nr:hypothetical protein K493DRAFT_341896 [Basidiobolus meristosporus CBS 931.73]|eukprot:ORX84630.1 hypothetical protein K493DRAFT_341896 [Basidiobolus meristosporus CBS 931.73]